MDPISIALITVGLLVCCLILGVHVGVAMLMLSLLGVTWITGSWDIATGLLGDTCYDAVMDYFFGAAPMFILMGNLANTSGISKELYDAASIVFARIKGGIAMATVAANAVFAAVTGVSLASVVIFSKISVPQMKRLGYNHRFALGVVGGSSVLGMLIPPSVLFIIYGILAEESIGKLFIAGIIPGIILSLTYALGISLMVHFKPSLVGQIPPEEEVDRGHKWRVFLHTWGVIALMILVLGGIYAGFFTPTEAGAIGALGALILTIVKKKLTLRSLWHVMLETGSATASIYLLFIAARLYSRMLTMSGLPADASNYVASLHVSPLAVVWMFIVIILFLGCILDSTSILVLTIPLILPILKAFNCDLIWFGVVCVVAVEMGLLTPPFGMVPYSMQAVIPDQCTLQDVFIGSIPFLIMMFLVLILLVFLPVLSTWLPSLM